MKLLGKIVRIERSRSGVSVIIETDYGLRGIELERALWAQVLQDFKLGQDDDAVGLGVEYDPAHGDLDVIGVEEDDAE